MDLQILKDAAPWDWPEGTGREILRILLDEEAHPSDRILAAELAGNYTVLDDELALALMTVLANPQESENIRCRAVISLGPALEQADVDDFENSPESPIKEETFRTIQETLYKLYKDALVPKEVRRRILEASARSPQKWHENAVRKAYSNNDDTWKLTAVFCMRFVPGFDSEILESLESANPDIHYQAVCAAGNWGVEEAWPHISNLLATKKTDKDLLLAAIDAAAGIRPEEAAVVLADFTDSEDQDIVDAAYEAMAMAGVDWEEDEYDEEDDEDDEFF
jgi:hypothetical protein